MKYYTISLPDVTPIKLISAKASYGVGFLTAFVGGFCAFFGCPNNMYANKIEKAEALAMSMLETTAKQLRADGVMDIRCQIDGLSFFVCGTAYKLNTQNNTVQNNTAQNKAEPAVTFNDKWVCKSCKTENSTNHSQCKKCGLYRGESVKHNKPSTSTTESKVKSADPVKPTFPDKWVCKNCQTENSTNHSQCKKCGQFRS